MTTRWIALALIALGPLATACGTDNGTYYDYNGYPQTRTRDTIIAVDIDTSTLDVPATIAADGGAGVGLFVEYLTGGSYHLFATCDTMKSGHGCQWDVLATIDPTLKMDAQDDGDLESDDAVVRVDDAGFRLFFNVDVDFDGVVLTVPPQARLRLDELLYDPDPNVITDPPTEAAANTLWISGGALQRDGAPSNPVDFNPTAP
jgi:hypothetical protein